MGRRSDASFSDMAVEFGTRIIRFGMILELDMELEGTESPAGMIFIFIMELLAGIQAVHMVLRSTHH